MYVVDGRIVYENVLGKPVRKNLLRDQGVGVSIILKWILEMWEVRLGTGSIWLWICVNMRLCEHSNEHLFVIEDGEFLD